MLSFSRLLNLPVIDKISGKKIGRLTDVYLTKGTNEIYAIVVTCGSIIYRNKIIKSSDVLYIAGDAVYVNLKNHDKNISAETKSYLKDLVDKEAFNDKGNFLGKIKEGIFDVEAGYLEEIEIGRGFTDDLMRGRPRLKVNGNLDISKDSVTVETLKNSLRESKKGIKNIVKKGSL